MSFLRGRSLLGRRVDLGARTGRVEDVVLGADLSVALGFVVDVGGQRGFLPWVAAGIAGDVVVAPPPSSLLGTVELAYYLESGVRLAALAGAPIDCEDRRCTVDDVVLATPSGRVSGLTVADDLGGRYVDVEETRVRWQSGRILELSIVAPPATDVAPPAPGPALLPA